MIGVLLYEEEKRIGNQDRELLGRIKAVERRKSCDHLDKDGMGQILVMMGMRYVLVTLL